MAKGSGGTRGGGASSRISYIQESEKAVKLNMNVSALYAGTDKSGEWAEVTKDFSKEVWVPKSQIENGKVSTWIQGEKVTEVAASGNPNPRFMGMKVWAKSGYFTDAKGKKIGTFDNAITKAKKAKFEQGKKEHDELLKTAKEMGIKGVHAKMKSSTLSKKIWGA